MRILVVRIGRAGDIVMSTPALNAVFDKHPDAEVTVLTSPDGRRLLKNFHPRLDGIWAWDRTGLFGFLNKKAIKKKIAESTFDIIYCFDTDRQITSLFNDSTANFYGHTSHDPSRHCASSYLHIIEQAAGKLGKEYYAYLPVDSKASVRVNEELEQCGITPEDTVIMLHPSYSGYTTNPVKAFLNRNNRSLIHRFWPSENFAELADKLASYKTGDGISPKVIIDLIPDEAPLGQDIINISHDSVILLQVKPDFERYKALIKRADLLIAPNTGPMHIAAAVDTKVVALFSDWNPVDCGPFMNPSRYKIIRAEDMLNPEQGLAAINSETVFTACKSLLH